MTSYERGLILTKTKVKDANTGKLKIETQVKKTDAKWNSNNFYPKLLQNTKPLIDNTHTPRGAKKAITLDRNFDRDIWVYNKNSMGDFSETMKDKQRGK